jgi:hypothetical protein
MMEAIHDSCRAEGIERLVLNASTFGESLYRSLGYVRTDEPMMRLRLADSKTTQTAKNSRTGSVNSGSSGDVS